MFKVYTNRNESSLKAYSLAAKKFGLDVNDIELVSLDKFLFAVVYILAISKKKVYLLSSDSKKPEIFNVDDIDNIFIEKKTDLNLSLKGGRVINLTSVVGVKPGVMNSVKSFLEEIKRLR